ncbi:hypothetical protein BGZ68_004617 [Mortierella alpina]|nr:hypothetical protein BGZ68_004617 [Mortierella alpina]
MNAAPALPREAQDSRRNDDTDENDENDDSPGHSLVPRCEPDQEHLLPERAPSSLVILQEPCFASNFGRPGENYKVDFRDIISRDSNTDDRDSSYDDDNDENDFSGERATVLFYLSPWRQSSSFPSSYYPRPPDSQTLSALVRVIAAEGEGSLANLANATETLAASSTQSALPTAATTPHSDKVYPRGISCPALALNPLAARLCARAMADAREQQRELRVYHNNDMYNKARKISVGMDHSLGHFGDVIETRDISVGVLSLAMPSTPGYLDLTLGPHNKTIYSYDHLSSRYAVLGKRRRQSISEFAYGATEVSGWEQTLPAQGQSGANQSFEPLCPARANPTRSSRPPPCPQRQQQGRISVPMTMMVAMNGTGSAPMTRGQAVNVSSRDARANAAPASALISEGRIGSGEHESSTAYEGAAFTWSTSSGSDGMHSGQFPLPHYLGGNNDGNDRGNNVNEDHDRERVGADNDNETGYVRDRYFSTAQTTPVQDSGPHEQQHTSRHQAQPQHSMSVDSSPSASLHQQRQHAMERILPGSTSMSRQFPMLPVYPQENEPIAHQIRRAQSSHISALQRQWEQQQQEQQLQRQQYGAVIDASEASVNEAAIRWRDSHVKRIGHTTGATACSILIVDINGTADDFGDGDGDSNDGVSGE